MFFGFEFPFNPIVAINILPPDGLLVKKHPFLTILDFFLVLNIAALNNKWLSKIFFGNLAVCSFADPWLCVPTSRWVCPFVKNHYSIRNLIIS